ncbi:hypothetical protein QR680_010520 [Steinernema hermaphroditum]|uniref:Uncharacterized protein n=1 Tax=Steinernema hermaphroditum TaxID=289476 RepID=A0AA39IPB8_9BILA|nr:hypothetical protein QR680_010520 [Steinernema hermaphroditum]
MIHHFFFPIYDRHGNIRLTHGVIIDKYLLKKSNSTLKWHAPHGNPHGSKTRRETIRAGAFCLLSADCIDQVVVFHLCSQRSSTRSVALSTSDGWSKRSLCRSWSEGPEHRGTVVRCYNVRLNKLEHPEVIVPPPLTTDLFLASYLCPSNLNVSF